MRKSLLLIALFPVLGVGSKPQKKPFWKAKPEVYRQVVEEKRVFVSVTDHKKKKHQIMKLNGGGQIRAPLAFTKKALLDFENVFKNSSFVKEIQADQKHHFLFIRAEVYGLSNSMKIRWKEEESSEKKELISFEITQGILKGFTWDLLLEAVEGERTDVGILGEYKYKEFPLPAFFLKFGLEVVFQKVAIDLRSSVEESFKNETRK